MNEKRPTPDFWQRKLMAFLHDAPDKCFDIANHERTAGTAQSVAGFADEETRKSTAEAVKPADWFASAAERFVFPRNKCTHSFTTEPLFIHPLSSVHYPFPSDLPSKTGAHAETIQTAIGGIRTDDWHERFFLYWRRWRDNAAASTASLAFLPADTRIPDHTIWTHMAVTSALAPCIDGHDARPELLLFQLGPVQDFIAQARSQRDLWSGSYLISWLMAHAIKAVTDEIGPDAVIFPSLRGNGIFDALHRETFYAAEWESGDGTRQTTWERLIADRGGKGRVADWLLTPTLPNRFFAIVPPSRGPELARRAQQAVVSELGSIGEAVWQWLAKQGAKDDWKKRWDAQIAAFPQTAWAVQSWLDRETCLAAADQLPKDMGDSVGVAGRIRSMLELGEKQIPESDRDERYYSDKSHKTHLNNSGLLWSAHYALLDAKLAARRNTRDFAQWNPAGEGAVKDSLSGKDECIGDEDFWGKLTKEHKDLFTAASHRYGAMNLIKRLWCRPEAVGYLPQRLGLGTGVVTQALRADSTQEIAARNIPAAADQDRAFRSPYIAVLAIDGDKMGQWVSGAKTPKFVNQLAPKAQKYLADHGASGLQRLLTPSYHLQFSEALANFAMHQARDIVESHGGDLIYAGGDDVLAILPATRAIACAQALRAAFRTDYDNGRLYPGTHSELSCGIAVGHQNAPLQMLVKEAQKAEHRAKQDYGRAALAITLYKRSGEIIEWGCKWKNNALDLMARVTALTNVGNLSGRFPYALAELLQPYALDDEKDATKLAAMRPVVEAEVRHVLSRQGAGLSPAERASLAAEIDRYLVTCWSPPASESGVLSPASQAPEPGTQDPERGKTRPQDFINLFLAETFINRHRGED